LQGWGEFFFVSNTSALGYSTLGFTIKRSRNHDIQSEVIRTYSAYPIYAGQSHATVQFTVVGASTGTIAFTGVPAPLATQLFKDQSFFEQSGYGG
jgi:hypothetical protein